MPRAQPWQHPSCSQVSQEICKTLGFMHHDAPLPNGTYLRLGGVHQSLNIRLISAPVGFLRGRGNNHRFQQKTATTTRREGPLCNSGALPNMKLPSNKKLEQVITSTRQIKRYHTRLPWIWLWVRSGTAYLPVPHDQLVLVFSLVGMVAVTWIPSSPHNPARHHAPHHRVVPHG